MGHLPQLIDRSRRHRYSGRSYFQFFFVFHQFFDECRYSVPGSNLEHYPVFIHVSLVSWSAIASYTLLVSCDLDSFEEHWLGVLKNVHQIRFGCYFPHDETGVAGVREGNYGAEMPFPSRRINGMCYWHDLWLVMLTWIIWLRSCLPGFCTRNYFFLPSILFSLETRYWAQTTLKDSGGGGVDKAGSVSFKWKFIKIK